MAHTGPGDDEMAVTELGGAARRSLKRAESAHDAPRHPRAVLRRLRDRTDSMTALLGRLAAAESPSLEPAAHLAAHTILASQLRERGFRVRRIPGRDSPGHLLAVPAARRRGGPLQLLLGHSDTVWPRGTIDTMPVRLEGGRMYGPGVFDMKGGLVQMLFALDAAAAAGPPEVAPIVFIGSDEEVGSPESVHVIRRLARIADRVFVLEPAQGPAGALKTARKGVALFRLHVTGHAAHAGLDPERGTSAIHELARVTIELAGLTDVLRGITVNVGVIEGGLRPNVVAPEARAEVDARALTLSDLRAVEAAIRGVRPRAPDARISVEGGIVQPPMERTPGTVRLWEMARAAGSELGLELEQATVGGGSDGSTASRLAPTLDGLGPVGDGAHARHEHVVVSSLPERAALLALLLLAPPLGPGAPG